MRLPKCFRGDAEIISELELGHDSSRSVFDEMFPPQELALLAADGIKLGVETERRRAGSVPARARR